MKPPTRARPQPFRRFAGQFYTDRNHPLCLVSEAVAQLAGLLQQKETLLQEMQHRVGNSLRIIASILGGRIFLISKVRKSLYLTKSLRAV
jgi:two-component sensor histidine kinase